MDSLPPDWHQAKLVGRMRTQAGPTPIVVVEGRVRDTARSAPTVSELLHAWSGEPPGGQDLGPLEALSLAPSFQQRGELELLPPGRDAQYSEPLERGDATDSVLGTEGARASRSRHSIPCSIPESMASPIELHW